MRVSMSIYMYIHVWISNLEVVRRFPFIPPNVEKATKIGISQYTGPYSFFANV